MRTVLEESTTKKFRYDEKGELLEAELINSRKFKYSDKEARMSHIKEMEKLGWTNHGNVLENTGMSPTGPVYVYVAEFYKNKSFMGSEGRSRV
jgi:hypothetical protein